MNYLCKKRNSDGTPITEEQRAIAEIIAVCWREILTIAEKYAKTGMTFIQFKQAVAGGLESSEYGIIEEIPDSVKEFLLERAIELGYYTEDD